MPAENTPFVIQAMHPLANGVVEPVLAHEDGLALQWHAGQFFMFHFADEAGEFSRSYSISSPPTDGATEIRFCVSRVEGGRGTSILFGMKPGDRIQATGPFGRFVLRERETPERLLLVATGTGLAPYRAMLPDLETRARRGTDVHVVMGVRTPRDLFHAEAFREASAAHENLSFHVCYSREMPAEPFGDEQPGYVQRVIEDLAPDPATDLVYLCGNPAMIDEVVARLSDSGFQPRSIRREKYISPD